MTPTAGTKYSFGAAVRARGSGSSTVSDVSSVSAGSWPRSMSPVRQPAPPTSSGGRGRTTTGRGDLDGDGGGALPPRDPAAPTVHEEILHVKRRSAEALVASARAQADLARTSAAVNSAAVVKLAKDTVSHECQLYESRRFVASSGGSNIGWDNVVATIGDEGSSDALNKLSVLGANNDGAAARAELRLATPEADSVAKTPGGLFLAYGIGTGWFKQVADAVRDRDTARVRYGIRFVVTFRAIEAFCRVELGAPEGLTPEWCAFQTDDVLEVAADLAARARREGEPPAINDIAAYKKACLAMGTLMAVTYGKIVADRWTEYVKEVALLGSTFKWTLAYRKYLINAALTAFSSAVQASIDAVKAVNAAANDLAGVGGEANDPSVTDLVAMYGRVGVGGAPIFTKPEAAAFSTDHDHKTAPLASALRKLRSIMAKEAQKGLMNGAVNVALAAQSGAAFGNETASRRRQREKEEKRAASDGASKDPPTRGKGLQAPADDDAASNVDSTPPDTRGSGEAAPGAQPPPATQPPTGTGGGAPGSTALSDKCMALAKKDFAQFGAGGKPPCMKFETHTQCRLSDEECYFHHRKRPLTETEIAKLQPETRAWATAYGGFRSQKEVPKGERSGVIGRMIAEIDKTPRRSTSGSGIEVPERVVELYADVISDPRPLERELKAVLDGGGDSVFHERPEAPRWRSESAADSTADLFSQVPGQRAKQDRIFEAILPLVSPPLEVTERDHRVFMAWLVTVLSRQSEAEGQWSWPARIDLALSPSDVKLSPWLADPAALLRPSLRGSGPCPISGVDALIVYGACPVAGHLDEAAFNVYGWPFVAYQVGDVVSAGGERRINQCVTKGDSISDLVSQRQHVTPAQLAARSAAYSEALCVEATQLLEHFGAASGSVTLFQAEMRDTAIDRATWGDTDIGYVLTLGGINRASDVLGLNPELRRKIVFTSRRANAPLAVYVYDGARFGDSDSWVSYGLLFDGHYWPARPVMMQWEDVGGAGDLLSKMASLGGDIRYRSAVDWRTYQPSPSEPRLPAALYSRMGPSTPSAGSSTRGGKASRDLFVDMPAGIHDFCASFMASRDYDGRDGAEAPDNYISEGDIKRSPGGKAFEKFTLSKLMSLEPDPEVRDAYDELVAWAETEFDSKAVRSDPAVYAKLCDAVAAVGKLTTRTIRHYQCWRRAFAVFQSKHFNKHGTLASPARQEDLRGVNSDAVLDYIEHTTEHFVHARIDGEAPPALKSMPPYKSALVGPAGHPSALLA